MAKNVVFAFAPPLGRGGTPEHIHLLFHKRGLYQGDGRNFSTVLCPVSPLDWNIPVLRDARRQPPSVLMRFLMHPSIVCQYADKNFLVSVSTDHRNIRDSIVIAHKSILFGDSSRDNIRELKKNNNILLFDVLDLVDPELKKKQEYLDGLIICSKRGYAYFSNLSWVTKPLFFITHCIDVRIPERTGDLPAFSPLYHGAPENVLLYDSLLPVLPIAYCYPQYTPQDEWMQKTLEANFFYAVRPKIEDIRAKPFQKGFTAARLNANILIHRDDGDALHYLGEDYPYLIHEEPTEAVLHAFMEKAKKDFGGERWHKGLEIMRSLRPHFSHETIARQFWDMIARYA